MTFKTNNVMSKSKVSGFTIVELLVVIVVIGILAAITIVSYTGITAKANAATLQADLANAKKQIALYHAEHGVYPKILGANNCLTNDTLTPPTDTNYCLKSSSGNIFNTTLGDGTTYSLVATRGSVMYTITESTAPQTALTNCPTGFVLVPGSALMAPQISVL